MSCGRGFPPPRNPLLWVLTRVGATPCFRRSARSACSFAASALPRTLWPRLSLPSQMNWTSFLVAVADIAINQSLAVNLFDGDAVYFFQTRCADLYFFQTGAAQIQHAVLDSLIVDVHGAAAFHDDAADGVRDRHDLVDAQPSFVAVRALAAAD